MWLPLSPHPGGSGDTGSVEIAPPEPDPVAVLDLGRIEGASLRTPAQENA